MDTAAILLLVGNGVIATLMVPALRRLVRARYPGFRLAPRLVLSVIVLLVITTGVVVASLTQRFPAVVVPAPPGATSGCSDLTNETNPVPPLSGTLRFDCASAGPAFSTGGGASTPTFSLPTGYTRLGYASHSTADCSGSVQLISGTSIAISAGGYDYCVDYNVVGGVTLPSFTVTWSN